MIDFAQIKQTLAQMGVGAVMAMPKLSVNVHIVQRDAQGKIIDEEWVHNLIPTVGLAHVAELLEDATAVTEMGWMAVGSGTTAPAAGDTALETELGRVSLTSRTRAANVTTYAATFGPGVGTGALTEAGILNASSSGTLLARVTYSVKNKDAAETISFDWTVTVADDGV